MSIMTCPPTESDDAPDYRRYWRLEEDGTLRWTDWPYGPPGHYEDELYFEIEVIDTAFTASQIADELDMHARGLGDEDTFWTVCRWTVYRTQVVLDPYGIAPVGYGPAKVVAMLTPLGGSFQTTEKHPHRAKSKDTRRLDERGCDHHPRYCVASDQSGSS